jgi:hypothetical protein
LLKLGWKKFHKNSPKKPMALAMGGIGAYASHPSMAKPQGSEVKFWFYCCKP